MVTSVEQMEQQAVVLNQPQAFGPGTVVVVADQAARFTRFGISMQGLWTPPGTITRYLLGSDVTAARNQACEDVLAEPEEGVARSEWFWSIDDDHAFDYDILHRLLARNVDIVGPLCLRRASPFLPTACVDDDFMDITRYGPNDLVEVQHTGSSGLLVRRRVIEQMEPPRFELGNGISEDVNFCRKAVGAGFSIHVDMGVRLGHINTAVITAEHEPQPGGDPDGPARWFTHFNIGDGAHVSIEPGRVEPSGEVPA